MQLPVDLTQRVATSSIALNSVAQWVQFIEMFTDGADADVPPLLQVELVLNHNGPEVPRHPSTSRSIRGSNSVAMVPNRSAIAAQ
jgi:hypothetical protein